MSFINWSDYYRVGVDAIDTEHEKLAMMINHIHDDLYGGIVEDKLETHFAALADFAARHFAHEESLFERTQYPDAESHRELHEDLRQRFDTFQESRHKAGEPNVLLAAELAFLRYWLLDHIDKEDRRACAYLNQHGIR